MACRRTSVVSEKGTGWGEGIEGGGERKERKEREEGRGRREESVMIHLQQVTSNFPPTHTHTQISSGESPNYV